MVSLASSVACYWYWRRRSGSLQNLGVLSFANGLIFVSPESAMASQSTDDPPTPSSFVETQNVSDNPKTLAYPKPVSPPFPLISKDIELSRAMSASSKSSLYSLSRNDVIFEDEWLIVVNKPQGIYCESVLSSVPPFLGKLEETAELHLANRLDRDTSGVLLITKAHKIAAKLVKDFTEHKVKKTYLALSIGIAPNWDKIRIKSGHGRSKFGAWRVYAASDVGRSLPGGSFVRDMETIFEVLSVNGQSRSAKVSESEDNFDKVFVVEEDKKLIESSEGKDEILVRAFPRSGRTHQIRLHSHFLGMPIKGDVKYHGVHMWKGNICDGYLLHAESLSFKHPVSGVQVFFQAPMPLWATQVLQST